MSSAILQCIAIVTMMIDHIGFRLFPGVDVLRMIGRIAFPLFAFMLAEGFVHTSSRKNYLLRLGIFALVSEIPYQIFRYGPFWTEYVAYDFNLWSNIFFELILIFVALWFLELSKKKGAFLVIGPAGAIAMAVLAYRVDTMYGAYGVLMGICFYLFREKRWLAILSLAVLTAGYCFYHQNWLQFYAIVAAIPIWQYNGKRGPRLPRYFSYAFYPAHLLVIYGLYWMLQTL